jgi:hypothetical protein
VLVAASPSPPRSLKLLQFFDVALYTTKSRYSSLRKDRSVSTSADNLDRSVFDQREIMSLPSSGFRISKRFISGFKVLLNPKALRGLFRSHSDRGHERYRRAGISASACLIQRL